MQSAMRFLESATSKLLAIGVPAPRGEDVPVIHVLERLEAIDPDRVLVVGRTLQHAGYFNEVVRNHISAATLADRYADIAERFTSIRRDAQMMVSHVEDGRLSVSERAKQAWMKFRRGSLEQRFKEIAAIYKAVAADSHQAIQNEQAILSAYADFRSALKQAEVEAYEIHGQAHTAVEHAQTQVNDARTTLDQAEEDKARAQAELARDLAINALGEAQKAEQVAKDLAENLKISYATGEAVMGRLSQATQVKERVYEQSVSFFATNETVLTALSAAFVSMSGLHESTQTLNAMKDGVSDSIETLANVGDDLLMEGTRTGYGPTVRAESVEKLVASIVDYQERTFETTREMRRLSSENAERISEAVADGKIRYQELMHRGLGDAGL